MRALGGNQRKNRLLQCTDGACKSLVNLHHVRVLVTDFWHRKPPGDSPKLKAGPRSPEGHNSGLVLQRAFRLKTGPKVSKKPPSETCGNKAVFPKVVAECSDLLRNRIVEV